MMRNYNSEVLSKYYSDESVFSIFIKNLPDDTNKSELEEFLRTHYKIGKINKILFSFKKN